MSSFVFCTKDETRKARGVFFTKNPTFLVKTLPVQLLPASTSVVSEQGGSGETVVFLWNTILNPFEFRPCMVLGSL